MDPGLKKYLEERTLPGDTLIAPLTVIYNDYYKGIESIGGAWVVSEEEFVEALDKLDRVTVKTHRLELDGETYAIYYVVGLGCRPLGEKGDNQWTL